MYSELDPSDIPPQERLRLRELVVPALQIVVESLAAVGATTYGATLPTSDRQWRAAGIARLEAYANGEPLPPHADARD